MAKAAKPDAPQDVPPHSLEAERAVLGSVILDPDVMVYLPGGFSEAAFYRHAHALAFRAMRTLQERRTAVDYRTLTEELKRTGDLEEAGGPAYLAALIDGVPRATNIEHYANVVLDHAARREVIRLANKTLSGAYEAQVPPGELIADLQHGICGLSDGRSDGFSSVADLVGRTIARLDEAYRRKAPVVGIPTGYRQLDAITAGLQRGELILLAARPSQGKTALAMNIAAHAGHSIVVMFFSAEMTKDALMLRLVASKARVEGHHLRTGTLKSDEWARVGDVLADLGELGLVIDDSSSIPVEDMLRKVRKVAIQKGPVGLVVVDYLQLLRTRSRFENRTQQVSFISGMLKDIAKELDVPVLALSQLSRAVEMGKKARRPVLADLRESGALEQDADVVMFLHRPDEDEPRTDLIIAKQRNGPVGCVPLHYTAEHTRFDNVTNDDEPERDRRRGA